MPVDKPCRIEPRRLARGAATALLLAAAGCQPAPPLTQHTEVKFSEDAADIYVSALPPVPWSSISSKLVSNNALTAVTARALAAQTTEVQVGQFLSTFAAGLNVGLPGAKGAAATVPSSSGVPTATLPSGAPVPSLTTAPLATQVDGGTLITAGTALFQLAQILDNQIQQQFLPSGYQVNLITFQVNLQPKRRDLSYDAYVDVTLLPSDLAAGRTAAREMDEAAKRAPGALPPVMLYPLVITDSLETASVGRSIQAIRQAALSLSGLVSGVGISAGTSGASDSANSIVGLDKNSLVTAGRINDNTFRLRLGAENSGSSGLAMVPRSYNVSFVVLTRAKDTPINQLSAVAHTVIAGLDGKPLPTGASRDRPALAQAVKKTLTNYHYHLIDGHCGQATPELPGDDPSKTAQALADQDTDAELTLLRAVDRQDFVLFDQCLGISDQTDLQRDLTLKRLLPELAELQYDSRYSTFQIYLPWRRKALPPEQLALVNDDKKLTTIILHDDRGLEPTSLRAWMWVYQAPEPPASPTAPAAAPPPRPAPPKKAAAAAGAIETTALPAPAATQAATPAPAPVAPPPVAKKPPLPVAKKPSPPPPTPPCWADPTVVGGGAHPMYRLLASAIALGASPSEIDVSFSSLAQAKLSAGEVLCIALLDAAADDRPDIAEYHLHMTPVPVTDPQKNPVTSSSSVLVADQTNQAQVTLQVASFDATKPLFLKVAGADVRADTTLNAPATTPGGVPLTPSSVVTLLLGNITPAHNVTLTTVASDGTTTVGAALTFAVALGGSPKKP